MLAEPQWFLQRPSISNQYQNGGQFRPIHNRSNIFHYLDSKFQNFRSHSIMAQASNFMRMWMQKVTIPAFIAIFVSVVDTHNIRSYRIIYLSMGISFFLFSYRSTSPLLRFSIVFHFSRLIFQVSDLFQKTSKMHKKERKKKIRIV